MVTKTLKYHLVVDWKKETVRARKTPPSGIGPFELHIPAELEIEIPDVDVPSISERLEVPQPSVQRIALEAVFDQEFPEWADTVDEILDDAWGESDYTILGYVMEATGGVPAPADVLDYVRTRRAESNP